MGIEVRGYYGWLCAIDPIYNTGLASTLDGQDFQLAFRRSARERPH